MAKEGKGKGKAGVIFTLVMVLCCIGLYLLGSRGEEEIVATSDSSATPVPVQEKQRAYPSAEVFFDRAKEYGLEAEVTAGDNVGAMAKAYSLTREDLPDAELVLSLRNGGICAFTLTVPAAPEPDPMPNDPTPVEISLYEQRITAYELEGNWLKNGFTALVSGLDIMGEVTYGDITAMLSLINQTAKDGKDRDTKAGDFEHTVSLMEDMLYITVSVVE